VSDEVMVMFWIIWMTIVEKEVRGQ